ncbi:hypothetical protein [Lysobacter xanthus]
MNPIRRLAAVLLALAAVSAMAAPPPKAGMVVDVQGPARLVADGASKKLELLAYVAPGTRIEVDAGGQAAVSLYASRSVYRIVGPAVVDVGATGLVPVSGAAPVARSLAQKLVASAQPGNRVHGAVRMRDGATDLALVTPETGAVLLHAPGAFHWEATVPGPYTLVLLDLERPGTPLVSAQAQQTTWMRPADLALVAGHAYRWSVSAPGSAAAASGEFTLAATDVVDLLGAIEPAADAAVEDWVLYATALQEQGVRDEARAAWKKIAAMRPDLAKAKVMAR